MFKHEANRCAQGVVERANQQVVIRMLKLLSEERDLSKWSETLKTVATAMNLTPHSSLGGRSPFDVTRRFAFRWMGPAVGSLPVGIKGDFVSLVRTMEAVRLNALKNLITHKSYNYLENDLKVGDIYFRRRMSFSRHNNPKLQVKVVEAYKIVSKVGSGVYEVRNIRTNELKMLPIDQLIKTNLKEEEVVEMLRNLEGTC